MGSSKQGKNVVEGDLGAGSCEKIGNSSSNSIDSFLLSLGSSGSTVGNVGEKNRTGEGKKWEQVNSDSSYSNSYINDPTTEEEGVKDRDERSGGSSGEGVEEDSYYSGERNGKGSDDRERRKNEGVNRITVN